MADRSGYIGRAPGDSTTVISRQLLVLLELQQILPSVLLIVLDTLTYTSMVSDKLMVKDYLAQNGSTFSILNGGADDGDAVEAVAYKAFNLGSK